MNDGRKMKGRMNDEKRQIGSKNVRQERRQDGTNGRKEEMMKGRMEEGA
jgi:hypothetical protein